MRTHSFIRALERAEFTHHSGMVTRIGTGHVEADGPLSRVGDYCEIGDAGTAPVLAEVVVVEQDRVRLMPCMPIHSLRLGAMVTRSAHAGTLPVGDGFAGRAVDSFGRPLDDGAPILPDALWPRGGKPLRPLDRVMPGKRLVTGLRAIDGLLALGKGQRVGIFAASGVGKTSLVDQLARHIACDRVILCLVGERGREVEKLWRTHGAGEDGKRFTLVAATADESASLRARSVEQAMALAEYWRDRGEHVLLMVDSITRVALALRELGLASGEPPSLRAFTPNVFATLPHIVERCGAARGGGAITAIVTVLSETDDVDDPIVELMKSVLDGHIVLSRTLAERRHFPAIDMARSVSRLAGEIASPREAELARKAHAALARHAEARPMIESGLYRAGSSAEIDRAIAWAEPLAAFLQQDGTSFSEHAETIAGLTRICGGAHAA